MKLILNPFKLYKEYQELALKFSNQALLIVAQKDRIAELEFENKNLQQCIHHFESGYQQKRIVELEHALEFCKNELTACVANQPTRKEKRAERNKRGSQ